jgi:hypothetical protein
MEGQMKRAKATGRPQQRQNAARRSSVPRRGDSLTVRPSRLRMFAVYVVMFAAALAVGMIFRMIANGWEATAQWITGQWPALVGIIFGGGALMAVIEHGRWTLRLLDGDRLEGPTGMFGERIVIPTGEIDWERTRRSMSGRLKMGNAIYGPGRTRILISPWFFEPAALRELLDRVGI